MTATHSAQEQFLIKELTVKESNSSKGIPMYSVRLFEGEGKLEVDGAEYDFYGKNILFTTPFQVLNFKTNDSLKVKTLQFHGDFYCIEYHKLEVACNGLLFNNIYDYPFISVGDESFAEIHSIFNKIVSELKDHDTFSKAVVSTYLQLILALCSKFRFSVLSSQENKNVYHPVIRFKSLLETHFYKERQPSFYAEQIAISPNAFSKACRQHFLKSPSALIHERVILEAKKLIHLTHKSMKQVAAELHFEDENYFSRYFKKHVGVSPTIFREQVGISIVADLSR